VLEASCCFIPPLSLIVLLALPVGFLAAVSKAAAAVCLSFFGAFVSF
jgi:hypothetical protein